MGFRRAFDQQHYEHRLVPRFEGLLAAPRQWYDLSRYQHSPKLIHMTYGAEDVILLIYNNSAALGMGVCVILKYAQLRLHSRSVKFGE